MKNVFTKFAREIGFKITTGFTNVEITSANLDETNDVFEIIFHNNEIISFDEMIRFLAAVNNNFKYKVKFQFDVLAPVYDEFQIKNYLNWIIGDFLENATLAKSFIKHIQSVSSDGVIEVVLYDDHDRIQMARHIDRIKQIMQKFGFVNVTFKLKLKLDQNLLEEERQKIVTEYQNHVAKTPQPVAPSATRPTRKQKKHVETIADLYEQDDIFGSISFHGKIANISKFKTKSGLWIYTFNIHDYSEAIYCKAFARNEQQTSFYDNFHFDDEVQIIGKFEHDTYTNQKVVNLSAIKKIVTKVARVDSHQTPRVELGFRSKMSTMDGLKSAAEIVTYIKKMNQKAVAIVDTNSVQSFPELHHTAQKLGVKPIYGATVKTISRNPRAIVNATPRDLATDEYVVFDLETTGLSPEFNDIIEFGAIIVKNNQVVKKVQFFMKPTHPIPAKITEITKITDRDVAHGLEPKAGIKAILDLIGSRTIVAHNANFDYTFLQVKAQRYLGKDFTNPVIDTLITSRLVFPETKRFRLESIAKKYNVVYDNNVSHRADYDAEVLSQIWMKQIGDLKALGIMKQTDLKTYRDESLYYKQYPYEVSVLAKNQAGLKELFHVISMTLTDNMYKEGKYFMEDFADRANILIGSSALKGKLVDLIFTGSKAQIKAEISKYDYIEIQPLQNFHHLVDQSFSKQDLITMLKFIITEAKAQGKIVVATGDVRYFEKVEQIYHRVYINAKGLGGVRHYLFKYDKNDERVPEQHLLTTQEMLQSFNFLESTLAQEIVISNSHIIVDMIEKIDVLKKKLYTPNLTNADQKLEQIVYQNARAMYGDVLPEIVEKRLRREIEPIKKYGYAVIYWIAHMLVAKSLAEGYLVGSRGSVGSSLVATMANITEVNPLVPHYVCSQCKVSQFFENSPLQSGYDLPAKNCEQCDIPLQREGQKIPFETFLGFEADKIPDIDLNFSGEYQPVIHNEVRKIFGTNHSFRAGTISTVAEKTAFGYVKAWSEETNHQVSRAFTEFLAKKIAGTKRTTGQHPGGIIIIPNNMEVEEFSPINFPANDKASSWKTTHFDFHAIHDNVLKLDILGHDDPTAIRYLEMLTGVDVKDDIPFFDQKIISLFSSPEALGIKSVDIDGEQTGVMGIPEFGTTFVRRMLKTAKVKSFGDLIAVSGLSHGTDVWAGNADQLIRDHKTLAEVISCRDNIMTDLMAKGLDSAIAFEIMEKVRKGKGLSDHQAQMLQEHGVPNWYILSLNKIKYMFPKAHATAYVMMAWRIAWFKLYHPHAYYATFFTTRADVFDIETITQGKLQTIAVLRNLKSRRNMRSQDPLSNKEIALIPILEIAAEAFARNIEISNIDITKSAAGNWIIDPVTKRLIPPFVALDGLGRAVAESIIAAREQKPFSSIEDLQNRTQLNKTIIQKMRDLAILNGLFEKNQISLTDFLV